MGIATEQTGTATRRSRPKNRKQVILAAAGELFRQRGYHSVGIDDIGAAVGISGPAIYSHYRSKDDLLVALLEQALDVVEDGLDRARSMQGDPQARLRELVTALARVAVGEGYLAGLYVRESHHLPAEPYARLERRRRAIFTGEIELLRAARPDLSEREIRARLFSVTSGLVSSAALMPASMVWPGLDDVLVRMAMAALLVD